MSGTREVSRRTVLKVSAWSAPVIAVAATTPLAAASDLPRNFTVGYATWRYIADQPEFMYIRATVVDAGTTAPTGFVTIDSPVPSGPYYVTSASPIDDGTGRSWDLTFALTEAPAPEYYDLGGVVTLDGLDSAYVPTIYYDS